MTEIQEDTLKKLSKIWDIAIEQQDTEALLNVIAIQATITKHAVSPAYVGDTLFMIDIAWGIIEKTKNIQDLIRLVNAQCYLTSTK